MSPKTDASGRRVRFTPPPYRQFQVTDRETGGEETVYAHAMNVMQHYPGVVFVDAHTPRMGLEQEFVIRRVILGRVSVVDLGEVVGSEISQ